MKENLDVDKNKSPELHEVAINWQWIIPNEHFYSQVKSVNPNVFIGMDVVKVSNVTTYYNEMIGFRAEETSNNR